MAVSRRERFGRWMLPEERTRTVGAFFQLSTNRWRRVEAASRGDDRERLVVAPGPDVECSARPKRCCSNVYLGDGLSRHWRGQVPGGRAAVDGPWIVDGPLES